MYHMKASQERLLDLIGVSQPTPPCTPYALEVRDDAGEVKAYILKSLISPLSRDLVATFMGAVRRQPGLRAFYQARSVKGHNETERGLLAILLPGCDVGSLAKLLERL